MVLCLMSVKVTFCLIHVQISFVRLRWLSGHLLEKNCLLFVLCQFVNLVISRLGLEGRIWFSLYQFLDIAYVLLLIRI